MLLESFEVVRSLRNYLVSLFPVFFLPSVTTELVSFSSSFKIEPGGRETPKKEVERKIVKGDMVNFSPSRPTDQEWGLLIF